MNVSGDVQGSLKEALYETLNGILSSHQETRQAAEQRIQALEVTEEFGVHLTEFVVDQNGLLPIRQLASVLLKQYVDNHWSSVAEKFRPPEIKHEMKERIKELLPLGLRESISKVRTAVAYAISAIAHWDWPENWPGLFDILVSCLNRENEYAVHGAMRVLTEFTRDLSDTHLPNVGPIILQEMLRIIQNETEYSIRIRGRAVQIFKIITELVAAIRHYKKKFFEQYLQPVIPMFCEKFVQCLRQPDGPTIDSGLKTDIIKALNCLISKLPKYVTNFLPQMLPPIWETLTQSAKIYQEEVVNGDGNVNETVVDSDGEIINFNNLIIATFDFIGALVENKKFSNLLENFQQDIMYYLILFMQVTDEQIEQWTSNPIQFIEEDEQTVFAYNVRISAQELLVTLTNHTAINSLCNVVTRHVEESNRLKSANNENWWKIQESSIIALSLTKDFIVEQQKAGVLHFDIGRFLVDVVLATLNDSGAHPLLLGRCLCLGGKFAKEMQVEISSQFLQATVNGLQENQPICIRISAVKGIYSFCEASSENEAIKSLVCSNLPTIFQGLFSLVSQPSTEVLTLVMETLSSLILIDKNFTASVESKVCPFTIAAFLKFHNDQIILPVCQDIFKALSQNPDCIEPLHNRLVPTLVSMMSVNHADKSKDERSRELALDVLQVLVQYSSQPLSNALVENAFFAACHCILNSEENGTLQSGSEVICTYLSVAAHQIIDRRDNTGVTGLEYILKTLAQLLNPRSSEFTAAFVGRLVTTLIRKAGNTLGENLDLLLKAVLSKMQRTETLTVMQSLLMVYAHLINSAFDPVLNFLSTVPGPTGQSALAFVLIEWLNRQHLFFGNYDRKVANVALSKLLEYGVTNDDVRLKEITVQETEGVKTRKRSQLQPTNWTTIPVLVKIFKVLISELSNEIENASAVNQSSEESEDDSDGENAILDPGNEANMLRLEDFEDDEQEEDPNVVQDSIYHLNLAQYLRDFLLTFSTHHCFPAFVQHLNENERKVLTSININTAFL
ncbi:importin-9 isoform X2 [Leptopilina heterotoma]|uniref:importin-9 isoform X2 n=1 Tax=Leptopilina heterotoma TaxID=63436 RepID=UPI001CA9113A|nr:importin-9 isoform X2 [Leptopilina heterotoma]